MSLLSKKTKMPEIILKSPEALQAQVATFAAEHIKHGPDKLYMYNRLGEIAASGMQNVTRVTEYPEHTHDEKGWTGRIPAETERTAATTEEYLDFLRLTGGLSYEATKGRMELLQNYDRFRPEVGRVISDAAALADPSEHPSYLAHGSNADVITINVDGKQYAVRIMFDPTKKAETVDGYVGGSVLAKGHPRFEQLSAISYEDGVTVGEMLPGKAMDALSPAEYGGITDEQLDNLVDDVIFARQKGIVLDPKPDNFHYDPEAGICMVDLDADSQRPIGKEVDGPGEVVGNMSQVIGNSGYSEHGGEKIYDMKPEDFANEAIGIGARLPVLIRYRAIVGRKLDDIESKVAFEEIDGTIAKANEMLANYTNPEWIQNKIADNEEYKRQRAANAQSDYDPADDDPDFNIM